MGRACSRRSKRLRKVDRAPGTSKRLNDVENQKLRRENSGQFAATRRRRLLVAPGVDSPVRGDGPQTEMRYLEACTITDGRPQYVPTAGTMSGWT